MNQLTKYIALLLKGILVGFGAILPGVSGGTLCVAFGMYHILLDTLSKPRTTLKVHGWRILAFVAGIAVGFIGLADVTAWLMSVSELGVVSVFIGFIIGTLPSLWEQAGEVERSTKSYVSLAVGFAVMLSTLLLLRGADDSALMIEPTIWSFLLCGAVWGTSFVVPGLSSSTLLMFFGLYKPMLEGISSFSMKVLIPLVIGLAACLLVLPRGVKWLYGKYHSVSSHAVLGIVLASTVSVFPMSHIRGAGDILIVVLCVALGAVASYFTTKFSEKFE